MSSIPTEDAGRPILFRFRERMPLLLPAAGWPLPAQRAAMMLAAATAAWLLRRHSEPLNTLLAALMLILLIDPAAIASLSLWLSFAATTGILLALAGSQAESGPGAWLTGMLAVTVVASLETLPS